MASDTVYQCDICERDIADPGEIYEVYMSGSTLRGGTLYMAFEDGLSTIEKMDVCPSCAKDVQRVVRKLTRAKE